MEASPDPVSQAELIVGNGRQSGARRPLKFPVTIIGSTIGCDVRLEVDSVRPIHCLIVMGPEGPHLRAWADDDTFVNDEPVLTSILCDGDTLRIGPFEFEIRVPAPVVPEVVVPPISNHKPGADVEKLHQQLSAARALFRRERTEHEAKMVSQLYEVEIAGKDLERREGEVSRERARLLNLRKRFIKRWKKHWETQRNRVEVAIDAIDRDRNQFESQHSEFESVRGQFAQRSEVESRRLEYGWEQLRTAERNARNERARLDADLDQRQKAVADQENQLKIEREALTADRMRLEHRSADLRIEADGIESRVVNLRAILLHLEGERARTQGSHAVDMPMPSAPAPPMAPANSAIANRQAELEQLAGDLADQRLGLIEQTDRLAEARQSWRQEESRVVEEMADLAEQLRRREEQVAESEIAIAFEEEHLDKDRLALRQLRERLEAWQSRHLTQKAVWRAEAGRLGSELRLRGRQVERREKALTELCHRWSERRGREVLQLRTEHRRCEKLRMEWTQKGEAFDGREKSLSQRECDVAARALVLEQARQQMLDVSSNRLLAEKRLERLDRHVRSAMAKAETGIADRWETLIGEREQLESLFRQTSEKVVEATATERSAANKTAEIERREYITVQREMALTEAEALRKKQREIDERERRELSDEIDRLAGLLLESGESDMMQLARAA